MTQTQIRELMVSRGINSEDQIRAAQEAHHYVLRGLGKRKVWGNATALEVARGYGLLR